MTGEITDAQLQQISLLIGEKLREIATRQGTVPFDTGDLRKAHVVVPWGTTGAKLNVNTPYARRVHDGSGQVIIRPRNKKALYWNGARHPVKRVVQPPRKGQPWIANSVETLRQEGLGFLKPYVSQLVVSRLEEAMLSQGIEVKR